MIFSLLLAAGVVLAEPSAPPAEKAATAKSAVPGLDDLGKMMTVFDKFFPAGPEPEPARLAKARGVAIAMWPDGTYGNLLESFGTSMADSILDMKPSDLEMFDDKKADAKAAKGKAATKPKAPKPDIPLREQMRRDDPYFDQRFAAISEAAKLELKRISPLIEPPLREGLSRALARRFNEPQLADIAAFYASPTGKVYATESMKMWFDGDIMRSMIASLPTLMLQMAGSMQRIEEASKKFPAPPKKKD